MNTWTIGRRITLTFALVLAIVFALGVFNILRLRTINADAATITDDCLPGVYTIGRIETEVTEAEMHVRKHIMTPDPAAMEEIGVEIDSFRDRVTKLYSNYEATITRSEDRALFEKMKSFRPEYLRRRAQVVQLSQAGRKAEATRMAADELEPYFDTYMAAVRALVDYNKASADDYTQRIDTSVRALLTGSMLATVLTVAVGLAAAILITRSTNRALRRVADTIQDGSAQVVTAAAQVSGASQSLAEGASEQASSLEQTSASLEEMASMTRRNTESAEQAREVAAQTRTSADAGMVRMQEMQRAMDAIKASSDDVAKIVRTIDDIAFQTNILALNAAVEAARAGEAGMGFAVVADEVRNLAQRSAASAKETSSKIEEAIDRSAKGVALCRDVAQSLGQIVENARKVDSIVAEIATASKEQGQGVEQVNGAIGQMDKVTQANAGNAEENASAAEELNAQAVAMREAVVDLRRLIDRQAGGSETPAATGERESADALAAGRNGRSNEAACLPPGVFRGRDALPGEAEADAEEKSFVG
jgi:methyl-accepting chemotaxis protein